MRLRRPRRVQFLTFRILIVFTATALHRLPTVLLFSISYNDKLIIDIRTTAKVTAVPIDLYSIHCTNTLNQRLQRKLFVAGGSQILFQSTSRSSIESPSTYKENTELNDTEGLTFLEQNDKDDDNKYCNDYNSRSMFGTKVYWDDLYDGRGDFPADTYSWYTNWNELQQYIKPYAASATATATTTETMVHNDIATATRSPCIFIPGIGNDSLLIDMIRAGYNQQYTFVVQDYSQYAMERQVELLQSIGCTNYKYFREDTACNTSCIGDDVRADVVISNNKKQIILHCCDITKMLPSTWKESFDIVIEKGLLDAVYLSDDTNTNLQGATRNLHQTLKHNGILISISSVIPNEVRHTSFPPSTATEGGGGRNNDAGTPCWEWIRDGRTDATKAGCFILRKIH